MRSIDDAIYEMPPRKSKSNGGARRIGFELEFSGIDLTQTLMAFRSVFDAEIVFQSEAEIKLQVEGLGQFNLEIDWSYLKSEAAKQEGGQQGAEWIKLLSQVAVLFVPVEVVCPPLPMSRISELHPMVTALKCAGAIGTEESFISAYGVHINAEIPALDAPTLSAYVRAYALLQWWLVDKHKIDVARRISPYINLYSEQYLKQVLLHPAATMDQIFDDYLEYNPSRNRALDLLPLLAEIDAARVRAVVDDARIQARPAFHFRLPDCRIEQDDWSLQVPWASWLVVEKLAVLPQELEQLGSEFLDHERPLLGVNRAAWVAYMDQWLHDRALL